MEIIDYHRDYQRMEPALAWLADHYEQQPSLKDTAQFCGLNESHFQQLFSRWVGLSPKSHAQYLTLNRAKQSLVQHRSVLDATYAARSTDPRPPNDRLVSIECMSPKDCNNRGENLRIHYGFHETPFSGCVLTTTNRGICAIGFIANSDREVALSRIKEGFENAQWEQNQALTATLIKRVFEDSTSPLTVLVQGTTFEVKVWEALLTIPPGAITNYADLAHRIGHTGSARAVGRAVAKNAIAYLIPCHRVIRKSGQLGGYRWDINRKLAMLSREHQLTVA